MEILSIPAILAIVEALKMVGLDSKYAPIVSIVVGIAFGLAFGDWVAGLILGLSASGLYSGVKKAIAG
jgi:hypothetical protein